MEARKANHKGALEGRFLMRAIRAAVPGSFSLAGRARAGWGLLRAFVGRCCGCRLDEAGREPLDLGPDGDFTLSGGDVLPGAVWPEFFRLPGAVLPAGLFSELFFAMFFCPGYA